MWKIEDSVNICYYLEKRLVAAILNKRYNYGQNYYWFGSIYSPNQSMRVLERIRCEDLDVLKLKCLVIAKNLGWEINTINT